MDPSTLVPPPSTQSQQKREKSTTAEDENYPQSTDSPSSINDDKEQTTTARKLIIGVCAIETKARSKPMRNILSKLLATGSFEAIVFGDKVILDEPVQVWPICDVLISFYSTGFPLSKAIEYVHLRRPYCLNDLLMQTVLLDRRLVLAILDALKIPTPRRLIASSPDQPCPIITLPNKLQRKLKGLGVSLSALKQQAPSPVDIPDGVRVGNKVIMKPFVEKPVYAEDHNIYVYYAERDGGGVRKLFRKIGNKSSEYCPELSTIRKDGCYIYEEFMSVDNSEDVKVYTIGPTVAHAETRKSPVVDGVVRRTAEGKELRYVTALSDAENGFAQKICNGFEQAICGFDLLRANGKSYVIDVNGWSFVKGNEEYYTKCADIIGEMFRTQRTSVPLTRAPSIEQFWKCKGFFCVLRHADRTPKQKLKLLFQSPRFVALMNGGQEEVVLKSKEQLKMVMDTVIAAQEEALEDPASLSQLKEILTHKGDLSGTKIQIKSVKQTRVQLIVKWGGEFTHAGMHQSKDLGENLRNDLLLINKELLDDVKVFSSSERRVTATAEVFIKHFLDNSEASLPDKITISKEMLDDSLQSKELMDDMKKRLSDIINPHSETRLPDEYDIPREVPSLPGCALEIVDILRQMRLLLRTHFESGDVDKFQLRWCCQDSPSLFKERWEKLFKDFCDMEPTSILEASKVSDLYDSLKYDLLHNRDFCDRVFSAEGASKPILLEQLYVKGKILFDLIGPQEYGIEAADKLAIGRLQSNVLMTQLLSDLVSLRDSPYSATRLYFTKESKVICLLNIVRFCGLMNKLTRLQVEELDYLTQITFELYELIKGEEKEYSVRIAFSPGAGDAHLMNVTTDYKHTLHVAPRKFITDHLPLDEVLKYLGNGNGSSGVAA